MERKEYTEDFIRLFINEDDLFDIASAWIDLSHGYGMMVDLLEDDLTVSEIIDELGEDGEIYEISSSDQRVYWFFKPSSFALRKIELYAFET